VYQKYLLLYFIYKNCKQFISRRISGRYKTSKTQNNEKHYALAYIFKLASL